MRFFFSVLVLSSVLVSCTKIKVERKDPQTPVTYSKNYDTTSTIVGYQLGMDYTYVNQTLDISGSSEFDSAFYTIDVKGVPSIRLEVRRDSAVLNTETYLRTGVGYSTLHKNVMPGIADVNGKHDFKFRDQIDFEKMPSLGYSSPDYFDYPFQFFGTSFRPFTAYSSNNTGHIEQWAWNEPLNPYGDGYFCFRFLDGNNVKYAWVHITVVSREKMVIHDFAIMK